VQEHTPDTRCCLVQAEASKWLEVYARLVYAAKLLTDGCKQSVPSPDAAELQVCCPLCRFSLPGDGFL
jgi:hypothetical protein